MLSHTIRLLLKVHPAIAWMFSQVGQLDLALQERLCVMLSCVFENLKWQKLKKKLLRSVKVK
jgi:hypothetical protein